MADMTLEEPLTLRNGLVMWSPETAFGTPVAAVNALELVTYRKVKRNGLEYYYGIGSDDFQAYKALEAWTELELRFSAVTANHKSFFQQFLKTAGDVPSSTVTIGQEDDVLPTSNKRADQVAGAKGNALEFSYSTANGPGVLTASATLWGLPPTVLTNRAKPTLPEGTPYTSNESVALRDGAGYKVRQFSFRLNNGLSRDHVGPAATPSGNSRAPAHLTAHNREISGTIQRYAPTPVSIHGDCPAAFPYVVTWTPLCGGANFVLTLADMVFEEETEDADENGIFWTTPFRARTWDLD
jgi:hypothetical protein